MKKFKCEIDGKACEFEIEDGLEVVVSEGKIIVRSAMPKWAIWPTIPFIYPNPPRPSYDPNTITWNGNTGQLSN